MGLQSSAQGRGNGAQRVQEQTGPQPLHEALQISTPLYKAGVTVYRLVHRGSENRRDCGSCTVQHRSPIMHEAGAGPPVHKAMELKGLHGSPTLHKAETGPVHRTERGLTSQENTLPCIAINCIEYCM